jgi:hypothetical protein
METGHETTEHPIWTASLLLRLSMAIREGSQCRRTSDNGNGHAGTTRPPCAANTTVVKSTNLIQTMFEKFRRLRSPNPITIRG